MTILDVNRQICHTEAVEDACGVRLVNVCHPETRLLGSSNSYVCSRDWAGLKCEEIPSVQCADACACACC